MEINPLAGLHPTHSDLPMLCTALEIEYVDLIGRIVESARARIGFTSKEHRAGSDEQPKNIARPALPIARG
jgi:D-alanine-D-alanine ligase